MGRRRIEGYAEEDAYTPWRRFYCYLQRAGAVKSIKRKTHRRERRQARAEIRREQTNQ
jgi:hypothetical protein